MVTRPRLARDEQRAPSNLALPDDLQDQPGGFARGRLPDHALATCSASARGFGWMDMRRGGGGVSFRERPGSLHPRAEDPTATTMRSLGARKWKMAVPVRPCAPREHHRDPTHGCENVHLHSCPAVSGPLKAKQGRTGAWRCCALSGSHRCARCE